MDILGYIAAFIMGGVLGSIGGGGSILTVPILVYLMGIEPVVATGYSLLIVGLAAAVGAYRYHKKGQVNARAAITFAVASIISVTLTRLFLIDAIPDVILSAPILITKNMFIMVLFAALMVTSSAMLLMNARKKLAEDHTPHAPHPLLVIATALGVGLMTGVLGAGGGFLIIPALVLLMQIPMKSAVGTSLLIIAINSSAGFTGDMIRGEELQMPMLAYFVGATIIGMVLATRFSGKVSGPALQRVFAIFTLIVATIIFCKEFL